ncbi:glycosyltransferase family 4 protein [Pseudarthrobacter sp. NPDC058329]|uniref:glycosyltransferase family 4 protein n=1 Tax=Pseudarthrobacter sp. NPDC058329 TaxID=3346448 RepID=UPI0036DCEF68
MTFSNVDDFNDAIEFTFVLGRVHDKIGGPTRTIWGYVEGLEARGRSTRVAGLGSPETLAGSFGQAKTQDLLAISGRAYEAWKVLYQLYRRQTPASALVIVGVWHLPFFVLGFLRVLSMVYPALGRHRILLIPTMSLTEYDWAKHRAVKSCIKPLVSLILRSMDGIIFASSGELELSSPRTWQRAEVVLHPSVSTNSAPGSFARDLDVLFVGRLDPQKDIPLLLESFAKTSDRNVLHLVGDGSPEYVLELRHLAEGLGVAERIVWHGWKTHSETLEYFRRARVVAVTSLVENFCHAAVEALVAETDLVLVDRVMSAVDFARLADIDVTDAQSDLIASCIQARLDDWDSRHQLRSRSASAVRSACSPTEAAAAVELFITDAVSRKAPDSPNR